ncbi:mannan endo-1,4-beta-mannosidase 5-like [Capsicum galapagoense]
MAYFSRAICSFFALLCLLAMVTEARNIETTNNKVGFVRTRGAHFVLDGSPFLFNGFNSYWLMHVAADPTQRYKVSEVFKEASAASLSVCRTWAFSDGGDAALQISPGVYDERAFQGLDFVISEARKYGILLILSFVNNYKDFGGRNQYAQWARNAGIQNINSEDDFYTHPVLKEYYKNHVKKIVTRVNTMTGIAYRDDSTIMAWELMNEPRCNADYSGKAVNGWVQEMASFVKSLDKKHLLEIGMEGFYGDSIPEKKQVNPGFQVGTDFISSHLVKEIDFATIHAYTDQWLSGQSDDAQAAFMQRWMTSHWQDSRAILKKPLVLAEFGKSSKDPGFNQNVRDTFMSLVYRNVYNFAKAGGTMGGSLVWQLVAEGMDDYDDGYSIVLAQNPSTAGLISGQSHAMTTLANLVNSPNLGKSNGHHPLGVGHHPLGMGHHRFGR